MDMLLYTCEKMDAAVRVRCAWCDRIFNFTLTFRRAWYVFVVSCSTANNLW